jgi:hypothetical protein
MIYFFRYTPLTLKSNGYKSPEISTETSKKDSKERSEKKHSERIIESTG